MVRDDTIQKLNADIGKLKSKHQEKLEEIQKQTETIKKLQDALTQCHYDLDETRKKAEEDVSCYAERTLRRNNLYGHM